MDIEQTVDEWKPMVLPALESKESEFLQMGYTRATKDDIWKCLKEKLWKGNPTKRIHEVVQDIFHLSANEYISYLTQESYQDEGLLASIAAITGQSEEDKS